MSAVYKKLEEVCEILDSRRVPITARDRKAGIYPYYGANGLQDYVAEYIFDDELVLLAEDGGNFGSKERPIAYRVSGKCWVNNHAHVLKAKPLVNVNYLCYALMFYDTEGLVNGATRQKLTQAAMRQMVIPYRDMTEQLQIVDEISQVIRLIEKRKEELELLDQLVKSRFIELFGDPMTNPKGFPCYTVGDVIDFQGGSQPDKKYFEYEPTPDNIRLIQIRDYKSDKYIPLSHGDYQELERVLTSELGSKEDYEREFGDTPFGLLIRKIAKLDHDAAMEAFSQFINDQSLNQKQIAFLHKIINHIEQNGYMESVTMLTKPPFDKPLSFTRLFDKKMQIAIMAAINKVKDNAVVIAA